MYIYTHIYMQGADPRRGERDHRGQVLDRRHDHQPQRGVGHTKQTNNNNKPKLI